MVHLCICVLFVYEQRYLQVFKIWKIISRDIELRWGGVGKFELSKYSMREILVVERVRLEPRTSLIGISDPTN